MSTPQPPRRLLTTSEAAELLDVPAAAIAKWKHREQLMPVGMIRGRGRGGLQPIYRLTELQPLADAYHRRGQADTPEDGSGRS